MKAALGLSGLVLTLTLAEYALAIGWIQIPEAPNAARAPAVTVVGHASGGVFGWGVLLGVAGLLASGGMQFRTRRVEKKLRRAMSEAQSLAHAAMRAETARAEREHFVRGLLMALQSQQTLESFGGLLLRELSERLSAKSAVFHCLESCSGSYVLTASYASNQNPTFVERYRPGEGLAGEAVLERRRRLCEGNADDWLWVETGTLTASPVCVVIAPIVSADHVPGVIELVLMDRAVPEDERLRLLDSALPEVALSLDILRARLDNQLELARREQRLRDNENKWRRLFESTHEGVWFIDTETRTTDVNPAMARILGESPEKLLGRSLFEFIDATHLTFINEQLQRRREGETGAYEINFKRADGQWAPCFLRARPLLDEQGRQIGSFAIVNALSQHGSPGAHGGTTA